MNNILTPVLDQIAIFLLAELRPGTHETIHSYMDVLTATEGSYEEKLRGLSQHILDEGTVILSTSNPTREQIAAMAVHAFFTEKIGVILKDAWAEKVASANKK